MTPLLITLFLYTAYQALELPELILSFALKLHNLCLNSLPQEDWSHSMNTPIYKSLTCGAPLKSKLLRSTLAEIGLVHFFVVSGAHLVFIESMLNYASRFSSSPVIKKIVQKALPFTLLGLTLICGLTPPITRALIQWGLKKYSRSNKFFWTKNQCCFYSCALSLALFPFFYNSFSFYLSATATVIINNIKNTSPIFYSLKVYILLMPLLYYLHPPQPISIITQPIFGVIFSVVIFSVVLFPMTFILGRFGLFTSTLDFFWNPTLYLLSKTQNSLQHHQLYSGQQAPLLFYFLYPILLFLFFHFTRRRAYAKNSDYSTLNF